MHAVRRGWQHARSSHKQELLIVRAWRVTARKVMAPDAEKAALRQSVKQALRQLSAKQMQLESELQKRLVTSHMTT